ncbi:MAG TPA: hypothetical protein VGI81_05825, partial [Tepidisphaeraceae bacterium]
MNRNWQTRALFATVLAMTPMPLLAQSAPGAGAKPQAAPETLANLGDKKLMSELADRGLDSLLDRYFDLHKTPEAEQKAIRSMEAMRELNNPKLSTAEKEKKIKAIVEGIKTTLPNLNDPFRLTNDAAQLMLFGVTRDANLLEYWGPNPATAERLRPMAQAVYDMLGKAARSAGEQAGAMASKITAQNQTTVGAQWERLDNLSKTSEYRQQMMAYYLALAMPQAERAPVVDRALKYLEDFDNADSTVMPVVHVMMGKLNMVAGRTDDALKFLQAIANKDNSIQPAPEPAQVWEARYFANVTLMQAGKVAEARKGLDDLIAWQKAGLPGDAETAKMTSAAAEMLRYRIYLKESELAKDPAGKKAADDNAVNVLLKLSHDRPDLRGTIYQQLVERMPADAPVKNMDPLLLQGLMAKAYNEANKPAGSAMDQTVLRRGLDAAREEAVRPASENLTAPMKNDAARLIPVLLEALGNKVEAAQAYLKYAVENAGVHREFAESALSDAGRLTFELRKTDPQDPRVAE